MALDGQHKMKRIHVAALACLVFGLTAEDDPILGIIGLGHGGSSRVSEEHDRVLAEHQHTAARAGEIDRFGDRGRYAGAFRDQVRTAPPGQLSNCPWASPTGSKNIW